MSLISAADIDAHDEYGKTPLHCAVGAQKLDIVHCLLRYRPDVDAHDDRDDTPLHTATRTGNLDIVLVSDRHNHFWASAETPRSISFLSYPFSRRNMPALNPTMPFAASPYDTKSAS